LSVAMLELCDSARRCGHHTLNLGLHIVDGVRRLHLKGDGLTREGLDENLHGGLRTLESFATAGRLQRLTAL